MHGIVKEFPGVRALDGVDLDVRPGEVHCLLGQNGAGKSTLIKVLSASYQPDEGTIRWDGEEVSLPTPVSAMKLGISTIYQELDLVPGLTVAENVFLGHELSRGGISQTATANSRTRALLERLGHPEISATRLVETLSPASQQIVSMARALSHETKLLVLDEPSAVLDGEEVENLFHVMEGLTAEGVAIVYISHRLEEIRRIGDRITVLKDGATVATGLPVSETPTSELIRLMTGRSIEYVFPDRTGRVDTSTDPVLKVEGLALGGTFSGVDLEVHAGEIVGLAGLVGAGRSEIVETVYGARRATAGTVTVDGKKLRRGSVSAAVAAGMGLCPEERKSQGLLLGEPISNNVTISSMGRFARWGFLRRGDEKSEAERLTEQLDVRPRGVTRPVGKLSGGNQQKVVLARWLLRGCRVLLLDEPTRGVDVGARSEIYALIRSLADEGVAVVVVSSEVEEVLGLADRVLVVREGRVVHESAATELDESRVLDLVMEGKVA
ncbi:sugar ABC transporter ATP-binding protein [Phycicoccus flavus]|uniref:sugar ABC transporter ATP-binding protein n=1 Tax=Phycicoccus flavus TaxID=2502783 RepID=UPI000FEBD31D|nr:sugar ABC transporter ATP-binding protein [Phycicoccus flavus]NHA69946.1 sugar ABC transporter ATP-binding protein [Phycicoccus flavus]